MPKISPSFLHWFRPKAHAKSAKKSLVSSKEIPVGSKKYFKKSDIHSRPSISERDVASSPAHSRLTQQSQVLQSPVDLSKEDEVKDFSQSNAALWV